MATEIRRFLQSSRVLYGLDIDSISLNFLLRSAYAGNRNGAWGGQAAVTNKPVTWLPFDHLGKVRILACPHWSWVAHPPCHSHSLTQLLEFERFATLFCILSAYITINLVSGLKRACPPTMGIVVHSDVLLWNVSMITY